MFDAIAGIDTGPWYSSISFAFSTWGTVSLDSSFLSFFHSYALSNCSRCHPSILISFAANLIGFAIVFSILSRLSSSIVVFSTHVLLDLSFFERHDCRLGRLLFDFKRWVFTLRILIRDTIRGGCLKRSQVEVCSSESSNRFSSSIFLSLEPLPKHDELGIFQTHASVTIPLPSTLPSRVWF